MQEVILDNVPFQIDLVRLLEECRVREGGSHAQTLEQLARDAVAVARPKAHYRMAFIDAKADDTVQVNGVTLESRVLRVNLESAHRVFVYVATCGTELDAWSTSVHGLLERYWADTVKEMALRSALEALGDDITRRYHPGQTSTMSPGSLGDWPLEEQRSLFALVGNVHDTIGVQLTESLLMVPTKSVSGIRFPTEESFESCRLCPRQNCPGRRARYDEGLYERKYKVSTTQAMDQHPPGRERAS